MSTKNEHIKHKIDRRRRYACNHAVKPTKTKSTYNWGEVTCTNCLLKAPDIMKPIHRSTYEKVKCDLKGAEIRLASKNNTMKIGAVIFIIYVIVFSWIGVAALQEHEQIVKGLEFKNTILEFENVILQTEKMKYKSLYEDKVIEVTKRVDPKNSFFDCCWPNQCAESINNPDVCQCYFEAPNCAIHEEIGGCRGILEK